MNHKQPLNQTTTTILQKNEQRKINNAKLCHYSVGLCTIRQLKFFSNTKLRNSVFVSSVGVMSATHNSRRVSISLSLFDRFGSKSRQ